MNPVPQHAIDMVRDATRDWTPDYLRSLLRSGIVPREYVEKATSLLRAHPSLLLYQQEDFMATCQLARPDLYPVLDTAEGRQWVTRMGDELGRAMVLAGMKMLGLWG